MPEVLPPAFVAVAVTTCAWERTGVKVKEVLPLRFVATLFSARKVSSSPKPLGMFGAVLVSGQEPAQPVVFGEDLSHT